jgi:hypothetical protein
MRMSSQPEKNEIVIWDETGMHPIGPTITRYNNGQIFVGGYGASVTGIDEEMEQIILSWDVETEQGWIHHEQRIRFGQYHHLLYGDSMTSTQKRLAFLEARQEIIIGYLPRALKELDVIYHQSYSDVQDKGQSYEQARLIVEQQAQPFGFTISYAECGDAGAGEDIFNYGGMRHVLVPLPVR